MTIKETVDQVTEETRALRKAQGRPVPEGDAEIIRNKQLITNVINGRDPDAPCMDLYTACSIVEGFCDEEPSAEECMNAWAFLISSGHCWRLQGWYGRSAQYNIIDTGLISKDGVIDWDRFDELYPGER